MITPHVATLPVLKRVFPFSIPIVLDSWRVRGRRAGYTLLCTTKHWFQPDLLSATQVKEQVAMDRFLRGLPPEDPRAMVMSTPTTPAVMMEALECALMTLEISHPAAQKSPPEMRQYPLQLAWLDAP